MDRDKLEKSRLRCRERRFCSDLWLTRDRTRHGKGEKTMTTSITTFLTYDTQAEEAATLYTSLFGGKITDTFRYPAGGPQPEGSVLSVTFELLGQTYIALNGGPSF